jgi:hypothetical protein
MASNGGVTLRRKDKYSEITAVLMPLCQLKPTRNGPESNLDAAVFTA